MNSRSLFCVSLKERSLLLVGWNNRWHLAISMTDPIQEEARQILDSLAFTPCDRCHPLSHDMEKATQLECSLEAAIEMAIASFLDSEAFSFEDCLLSQRLKESERVEFPQKK